MCYTLNSQSIWILYTYIPILPLGVSSVLSSKGYVRYIHVNHITHHMHTHTHAYVHMHRHTQRHIHTVRTHTHTDAYAHIHTCTRADTHTHTQSLLSSPTCTPSLRPNFMAPSPFLPMHPSLTSEHVLSSFFIHIVCTVP